MTAMHPWGAPITLRERCLGLAQAQAFEINGCIDHIDPDDLEPYMAALTEENLEWTAGEVAYLAHLCS